MSGPNQPNSETATGARVVVLPGMGADESMYRGAWRELANTHFLNWPDYDGESSLAEWAERLIAENEILPSDHLCGTSMGGMVALEIAARLGNRFVILVSSALDRREVNPALRLLSPLARPSLLWCAKWLVAVSPRPTRQMIRQCDPRFLAAACRAIVGWSGAPQTQGAVWRIHGARDWMIRCSGRLSPRRRGGPSDGDHPFGRDGPTDTVDLGRSGLMWTDPARFATLDCVALTSTDSSSDASLPSPFPPNSRSSRNARLRDGLLVALGREWS